MPLGLLVWNDSKAKKGFEGIANNEPGAPKGREMEFAGLLSFIKSANIRNTVWLTADVHYTAAHYYDPNKAAFQDFDPFWEFVSGPIHAGTFGPNELDKTFGPEVKYVKAPEPAVLRPREDRRQQRRDDRDPARRRRRRAVVGRLDAAAGLRLFAKY
jgi:alkaline phosphatase D